jgi:hypothetical protein
VIILPDLIKIEAVAEGRAVYGVDLKPLVGRDRRFEYR